MYVHYMRSLKLNLWICFLSLKSNVYQHYLPEQVNICRYIYCVIFHIEHRKNLTFSPFFLLIFQILQQKRIFVALKEKNTQLLEKTLLTARGGAKDVILRSFTTFLCYLLPFSFPIYDLPHKSSFFFPQRRIQQYRAEQSTPENWLCVADKDMPFDFCWTNIAYLQ